MRVERLNSGSILILMYILDPHDYKFQAPSGIRFTQGNTSSAATVGISSNINTTILKQPAGNSSGRDGSRNNKDTSGHDKTVKQLLGEMFADKEYLELLLNDKGNDDTISLFYSIIPLFGL